jgi:hypothetical protein
MWSVEGVTSAATRPLPHPNRDPSGGVQNGAEFSCEHRPVLLALIGRAGPGEYEVLLVARIDRLSRDHATLVVLGRRVERHSVSVSPWSRTGTAR